MELLPSPTLLIGENYQLMLKESIDRFLDHTHKGGAAASSILSDFAAIFFRLLQARVDPPLETIWFYSAVRFRQSTPLKTDLWGRVLGAKDLLQILTSCSASCDGLKSVAVVCPVLMELHHLAVELWNKKKSPSSNSTSLSKTEKKAAREVECLIEGVVGYVSICGCEDHGRDDALGEPVSCFGDLVRVWTTEEGNVGGGESLKVFLPMVSDEVREGFGNGEFGGGYLVGVAVVQAFLLRLCLKVRAGVGLPRRELEKELSALAVGSIVAFRNCCFFDILLRLLMEPTLPVTALLDSEEEALLRNVLYDVVILGEYSFLNVEKEMVPTSNCMKRLALRRLILIHEAAQRARENKDHAKAISYMNAFSKSCLPSNLVRWTTSQIGISEESNKPNVTDPQALLKWLLNLENRGARIFDNINLKARAKLALDESKSGYVHRQLQPESKVEDDLLFYIDNKPEGEAEKVGDLEMAESTDAPFIAAVRTMKFTEEDKRRKRKEERKGGEKTKVKFLKYNLDNSSLKENRAPSTQGNITSDSEEENHDSDEDMKESDD